MDLRITVADWMCILMATASGLMLLSLVYWWDACDLLLHRLVWLTM
jgi:hypothetical protein